MPTTWTGGELRGEAFTNAAKFFRSQQLLAQKQICSLPNVVKGTTIVSE
jgi:hypothetical protein